MNQVWLYTLLSVVLVSLVSFIGVLTLSVKVKTLKRFLIYFVAFAAGALIGDAFIHLLPEIVEKAGFGINISLYVLLGIISMFIIEKFIRWHHCHIPHPEKHPHPFAITNLIGDGVHNIVDGLIIAASYLVSIPVGLATTIAVIFHEIPQEIGDFSILLHGGFSRSKALIFNFGTALLAILGAVIALVLNSYVENLIVFLVPLAAGHFIYIAAADLIPEIQKEEKYLTKSIMQLLMFVLGIAVMYGLIFLEV